MTDDVRRHAGLPYHAGVDTESVNQSYSAEERCNRGNALLAQGRTADAAAEYELALQLDPLLLEAHNNLGFLSASAGDHERAVQHYRSALEINPVHAGVLFNLGATLAGAGRFAEAAAAYGDVLKLHPNVFQAHNNLATTLRSLGDVDGAIAHARRAIELEPNSAEVHVNLAAMLRATARHEDALAAERRAVELAPASAAAWDGYLFGMLLHPGVSPEAIRAAHDAYGQRFSRPRAMSAPAEVESALSGRVAKQRLRIGYVSPDFRDHVVGRNILPLLRHHDRAAFEIFCYANVFHPDGMTAEFQSLADHWCNIVGLSDDEAAARIRADGIDILVDLAVHTAGNRLGLFARKPAPVQITFAGYPGSTGLAVMDFRLTDPYLDPPGVQDAFYMEQSLRLPGTFWCYQPACPDLVVNALPHDLCNRITFACLNAFSKVNRTVLQLWSKALAASGTASHLMLMCDRGSHREDVLRIMESAGIGPDRIEFVERLARADYLKLYHRIDMVLDTFPYNGHTTTLDALWMGVPVITLAGDMAVGRGGLSQLSNLGLPELVARSPDEFIHLAATLSQDLPRLRGLRGSLRGRMEKSPLMNAPQFARDIEAAYGHILGI